jgi:DNA polymerase V
MSDLSQSLVLSSPGASKDAVGQIIGAESGNPGNSALTLDDLLIPRPASTVIFPVRDFSAAQYELKPGDLLVVDRTINPVDRQLVIISTNNELKIRRHHVQAAKIAINLPDTPENGGKPLPIWGTVTYIIRKQ